MGTSLDRASHPRGRRDALFAAAATLVAAVELSCSRARPATAAPELPPPSCSSCEGAVDGTLGRCEGFAGNACRSTFDDRPPYFAAPWEFGRDVTNTSEALAALERSVTANGGKVEVSDTTTGYLRASFGSRAEMGAGAGAAADGAVALEFLARGEDDAVCEVRGVIRGVSRGLSRIVMPGTSEVEKTLERVRRYLGWAEVPARNPHAEGARVLRDAVRRVRARSAPDHGVRRDARRRAKRFVAVDASVVYRCLRRMNMMRYRYS